MGTDRVDEPRPARFGKVRATEVVSAMVRAAGTDYAIIAESHSLHESPRKLRSEAALPRSSATEAAFS